VEKSITHVPPNLWHLNSKPASKWNSVGLQNNKPKLKHLDTSEYCKTLMRYSVVRLLGSNGRSLSDLKHGENANVNGQTVDDNKCVGFLLLGESSGGLFIGGG
jgi:hypothetical protein